MWELRAILCIPVYIITWQYWDPSPLLYLQQTTPTHKSTPPARKFHSWLFLPIIVSRVSSLQSPWSRISSWAWSEVGTEDSKHIPSPSAPVNTELRLIVYRRCHLTWLGRNYFPFISSDCKTPLISVGESWPSSIIVVSGVSWWRAADWRADCSLIC